MKKVILITGASTGFGALMARTFDKEGHTVIATMRNVNGKNAAFAETLGTLPNTEVVDLDVTDEASVKNAVKAVYDRHGKIDVLINNAGIYGGGVLEAYTIPQIQKLFDVNVWGVHRMNNAVLPSMRAAKDGLIITISSQVGRISLPLQSAYNASKFALEGLIEGSHAELIGQGVESVLLEPGGFITEIISKAHVNGDREGIQESYGSPVTDIQERIQQAFTKIFTEAAPDPQLVANAALGLVNMEKGKRPLRTPLDPSSKGIDVEYDQKTEEIKKRWIGAYGL
ncbi:SDR family oxidoreductase [Chitinophaga sp. S165]|uniref:SDR family oxidoreductase n=1 Tax=Chitinophaga sp. S165 TaxID=2135462 RepID=UPI000D71BBB0|nr:SDR family oxidoreductase [Chitinophaga sp. S165]PWV45406.1 NADP-dependent 3-hydroxy acid dehydrogenase YdfG [Chitinophaga sp. S165]